jgi:hypothetical protein
MNLLLTDREKEVLTGVVEQYYFSLREEIYKTEAYKIKEELKAEEGVIEGLLQKLQAE